MTTHMTPCTDLAANPRRPRPDAGRRLRSAAAVLATSAMAVAAALLPALAGATPLPASYTALPDLGNYSNPGAWEHHALDVSSLVAGASVAQLSFDLANDLEGTGSTATNARTNAHLGFASDAAAYYLHFDYFRPLADILANSSAHLRDVQLLVDGLLYRDQYAAFNGHLGDVLLGTAGDGDAAAYNILGQSGFDASTYVLTVDAGNRVPEPGSPALVLLALLAAVGATRASRRAGGR